VETSSNYNLLAVWCCFIVVRKSKLSAASSSSSSSNSLMTILTDESVRNTVRITLYIRVRQISLTIIRPHRSTTYVDVAYCYRPSSMVCRSVCLSVCHTSGPAKTAEPIKILFGLWARMGPRNHLLDERPEMLMNVSMEIMATIFGFLYMGSHWRHLAYTTEPSVCGSDAALCQITLTTCLVQCRTRI